MKKVVVSLFALFALFSTATIAGLVPEQETKIINERLKNCRRGVRLNDSSPPTIYCGVDGSFSLEFLKNQAKRDLEIENAKEGTLDYMLRQYRRESDLDRMLNYSIIEQQRKEICREFRYNTPKEIKSEYHRVCEKWK